MSKTIGTLSDLQLTVPSKGEQDWSDIMDAVHLAIANHNHTLNGTGRQIAAGALVNGAVTTVKITDAAITAAKIAADAITTDKILDGNVTTAKLADSSVTTAKLGTDSVTNDKIADNAVGTDNIIDGAITTAKILDANVTNAKMAANSVSTTNIIDANVTAAKLATNSVGTSNIIDANITTAKLADDAVDDTKIRLRNNQYLTARNAANNADINIIRVNSSNVIELAADIAPGDNTISTAKIQDNAVTGVKIADNTIDFFKLNLSVRNGIFQPVQIVSDGSTAIEVFGSMATVILKNGTTTGSSINFGLGAKARILNIHNSSLSITLLCGPESRTIAVNAGSRRDVEVYIDGGNYFFRADANVTMPLLT